MEFAEAVRQLMIQKGLSAKELAERSDVQAPYISKLLNGRFKEPTWAKACSIIEALGLTVDEFRQVEIELDSDINKNNQKKWLARGQMEYGQVLEHYLKEKGMTAAELASAVSSPRSTINALIKGRAKEPTLGKAKAIAEALGVSLEEMADMTDCVRSLKEAENEPVGMCLKSLRESHGLTQDQIGAILGIPKKTYQNYERGVREPSPEILCDLADHYGVSLDELFGRVHTPAAITTDEAREHELVGLFHQMNRQGQDAMLAIIRDLSGLFRK